MSDFYKKLPHIDTLEAYQFVTIRTQDSLDDYLKKIASLNIANAKKQMRMDAYLDASAKGCYFESEVLSWFHMFLCSLDQTLFNLVAFSIMPNHLHILFYQKEQLSKTMKQLKGSSALHINTMLNRNGRFWASGYYDKAIRDEKHFEVVYNYIRNNPIKANIKDADERFWSVYEK